MGPSLNTSALSSHAPFLLLLPPLPPYTKKIQLNYENYEIILLQMIRNLSRMIKSLQ